MLLGIIVTSEIFMTALLVPKYYIREYIVSYFQPIMLLY